MVEHLEIRRCGLSLLLNVVLLAASVIVFGAISVALGQDANWDLRNYHIYDAYGFLHGRFDLDVAPAQIQTYLNPLLDVATYYVITHLQPKCFGFVLGSVQGVNFWLVYLIAWGTLSRTSLRVRIPLALSCAAVGTFGAIGVSELGTTFHDLTTSPFALLPVLIAVRSLAECPQRLEATLDHRHFLIAGFVLGCGVGLKNTLAVYAIGFVIAWLSQCRSAAQLLRAGLLSFLSIGAGIAVTSGFWMFELWRRFGSPVFPFYNAVFNSPYFDHYNFSDPRFLPKTTLQLLFYPFYFTSGHLTTTEVRFQDLRLAGLYGICLLVVGVRLWEAASPSAAGRSRLALNSSVLGSERAAKYLVVFCVSSYVIWQSRFSIYRYLAPLEQLVPLVTVLVAGAVLKRATYILFAAVVWFSIIAGTLHPPRWGRLRWEPEFLGVVSPEIREPGHSLILITSTAPIAYVIPAFPASARFVRIESNFFDPSKRNRMAEQIFDNVTKHEGPLYLLTVADAVKDAPRLLAFYDLVPADAPCAQVYTRLGEGVILCELRRKG